MNKDVALKQAIELAKINIESSSKLDEPKVVIEFIESLYNYFLAKN